MFTWRRIGGLTAIVGTLCSCRIPVETCGNHCPQAISHLALSKGEATIWGLDGSESTLPIVAETTGDIAEGSCQMSGLDVEILPDNRANGFLMLMCNVGGKYIGSFIFEGMIPDPRLFDANTVQSVDFWGDCPVGAANNLAGSLATITVAHTVGGEAKYPAMVTPDFRRSYTVEIDTGAVDCSDGSVPLGCPICREVTRMRAKFTINQTAASYVYTTSGPCNCM